MSHDPHDPVPRLPAYAKNADDEAFLEALNEALERAPLPRVAPPIAAEVLPVLYIVGLPRSGTTLASQLVCRGLEVGYINNLIARFWRRPSVGIRMSKIVLAEELRSQIEFTSRHGVTHGLAGPHEFGYFWRKWLDLDRIETHSPPVMHLTTLDGKGFKRTLEREIVEPFALPVVFKNPICAFYASFLTSMHPRSAFIWIRRNPYAVAASILKCRHERLGSYNHWWSLKPATYPVISQLADPAEQVARQVADCTKEMASALGSGRLLCRTFDYEDICRRPAAFVQSVADLLAHMGTKAALLTQEHQPFSAMAPAALPEELSERLRKLVAQTAREV